MKKILFVCALAVGSLSFYSCDTQTGTTTDADEVLIERDTVGVEYEVEETIVETDTITRTETIERDTVL